MSIAKSHYSLVLVAVVAIMSIGRHTNADMVFEAGDHGNNTTWQFDSMVEFGVRKSGDLMQHFETGIGTGIKASTMIIGMKETVDSFAPLLDTHANGNQLTVEDVVDGYCDWAGHFADTQTGLSCSFEGELPPDPDWPPVATDKLALPPDYNLPWGTTAFVLGATSSSGRPEAEGTFQVAVEIDGRRLHHPNRFSIPFSPDTTLPVLRRHLANELDKLNWPDGFEVSFEDLVPQVRSSRNYDVKVSYNVACGGGSTSQPGFCDHVDPALSFGVAYARVHNGSSDLNHDNSVDAADAAILFGNWNGEGLGDINLDRLIDSADAAELFSDWSGDVIVTSAELAHVPEPAASPALLVALVAFLRRRQQKPNHTRLSCGC